MYLYDSAQTNEYIGIRWGKETKIKRTKTLHHFKCDNCGAEFSRPKNGKLRNSQIHYCSNCPQYSLAAKHSSPAKHIKYVEKGFKWSDSYKEIYVGENYPYRKTRWLREHIAVMEQHIGKRIPKGMVVHHIDGDKSNNKIDNLFLCTVDEHNKLHGKIEKVVFGLVQKGLIEFNPETHEYIFVGNP
jgi:predicted RNA-binding Zn-ribbon protein involved in translation (DUF1610 family)